MSPEKTELIKETFEAIATARGFTGAVVGIEVESSIRTISLHLPAADVLCDLHYVLPEDETAADDIAAMIRRFEGLCDSTTRYLVECLSSQKASAA
jgi:hypothetical protein